MNNVAEKLYNILGTKFDNTSIKTLNSKGKETTDMEEIEMFSFDFLVDNRNYGPVVMLLSAKDNLEVYYGDNTSKTLDSKAKKKWENLIEHLSTFARTNRLGFSLKHTTDLKYDLSNITDITESYKNIFEGYYGTRKTSYSPQGKAKIIIKHSKAIGEEDKRFRNISSLFIENVDGERFKLPFTKLTGARAMARHVTEGGNPYDLFGVHISEMVKDINTLGGFVRRSKMYEGNDDAMAMIETGRTHCAEMRKNLKRIAGVRGYKSYKEGWEPSEITEQDIDTDKIRGLFTEKVNQRTEDALPLLARLQQMAEASAIDWPEEVKGRHPDEDNWGDEREDDDFDWERHPDEPDDFDRDELEEVEQLTELTHSTYNGFKIEVDTWKKGFRAFARNRAGQKMQPLAGKTEQDAIAAVHVQIDQYISTLKKVSGNANVNLNAAFASAHLHGGEDRIWAKLVPGPKLVVAGEQSIKNEEILPGYLKGENFTATGNRKKPTSELGTDLLGFKINGATSNSSQAIANARYKMSDPMRNADGDSVYTLEFDSIVTSTNEKVILPFPALTVATHRSMGEDTVDTGEPAVKENTGATDFSTRYEPGAGKSRKELLAKFAKTKDPKDGVAARKAGATQVELKDARDEMKEINEFENWANGIVEGTWSLPDTPKAMKELRQFMSKEQPVGVDAINATDALYHILGDDDLFDALGELADDYPDGDARPVVKNFIETMYNERNGYAERDQAMIVKMYRAVSTMGEGCEGDLDADDETQLNASVNKHVDDHVNEDMSADEYANSNAWNESKDDGDEVAEAKEESDADRIANLKAAIKDETPRSKPGEDHKEQYARHAKKIAGYRAEIKKLQAKEEVTESTDIKELLKLTNRILKG